jgi:hypothetical protein
MSLTRAAAFVDAHAGAVKQLRQHLVQALGAFDGRQYQSHFLTRHDDRQGRHPFRPHGIEPAKFDFEHALIRESEKITSRFGDSWLPSPGTPGEGLKIGKLFFRCS